MTASSMCLRGTLSLVALAVLAGCVAPPQGPRVSVMPTPGKPLELFAAEDQYCRSYAQQSIGPDTSGEAVVGSAVVGTLLGAAVGSAMSGRRHNNTAAGAATGLVMGTAIGASGNAASGQNAQRRYDIAYEQCMVSKHNQPSQGYYRQAPAPQPYAYPYPPPQSQPQPPPLPPMPPPMPQ